MTGPEHYKRAEELIASAGEWMDADWGWKGDLTTAQRLAYRQAELAAAQVHATLAVAASSALIGDEADVEPLADDWRAAAGR
jgi:hypothetical protein